MDYDFVVKTYYKVYIDRKGLFAVEQDHCAVGRRLGAAEYARFYGASAIGFAVFDFERTHRVADVGEYLCYGDHYVCKVMGLEGGFQVSFFFGDAMHCVFTATAL
jgi:hypothetical protein